MFDMQLFEKIMNGQLDEAHFEALLQIMDALHDAAAAGQLGEVSPLSKRDVIGWLDDIIFTAEETIRELQGVHRTDNGQLWSDN